MPDKIATDTSIGAIRCECDGEMYPADDRGGVGGVNAETMDVDGTVDAIEITPRVEWKERAICHRLHHSGPTF